MHVPSGGSWCAPFGAFGLNVKWLGKPFITHELSWSWCPEETLAPCFSACGGVGGKAMVTVPERANGNAYAAL
jgi:hypothetical protein